MRFGFAKRGQSLFILSFSALICCGTLLLKLPWSYHADKVLGWFDALFMATSAVCITGLATVPVSEFTFFGQVVILLLIQLGGLGIMSLSASILLLIGRGLSFSNTLLISSLSDNFSLHGIEGLVRTVLTYTLISEAVGFALLFPGFLMHGDYGFFESLWYAFFHAVSAFCNAGLSPLDASMAGQLRWTQMVVASLAILGGLGVYVIYDLLMALRHRGTRLRVHSRLVLVTTAILLVGGTLLLWALGTRDGGHLPLADAFFQSASCRTAGFSTVNINSLPPASMILLVMFMLIGGSPGSTAGGMKTSTVALAFMSIINICKGNTEVLLFKRTIPTANVLRAYTLMAMFALLVCAGTIFLQFIHSQDASLLGFGESLFEVTSAVTTTGFSRGSTGLMLDGGKLLITFLMFIGRVGPFSIMLVLFEREKRRRLRYPEERVLIS